MGLADAGTSHGAPQSKELGVGSYRALYDDRPTQEIFLNGMTAGSLLAAQALAKKFPWREYRTIIDIGTAQGCVCRSKFLPSIRT